jgi:hypothetical protein
MSATIQADFTTAVKQVLLFHPGQSSRLRCVKVIEIDGDHEALQTKPAGAGGRAAYGSGEANCEPGIVRPVGRVFRPVKCGVRASLSVRREALGMKLQVRPSGP